MTADRALVAALVASLAASQTRLWHGERHHANCGRGIWRGAWAWGEGAPCSQKCEAAQRALAWGRQWLANNEIRQGELDIAS